MLFVINIDVQRHGTLLGKIFETVESRFRAIRRDPYLFRVNVLSWDLRHHMRRRVVMRRMLGGHRRRMPLRLATKNLMFKTPIFLRQVLDLTTITMPQILSTHLPPGALLLGFDF